MSRRYSEEQIEKAFKAAKRASEIEGLTVTEQDEQLIKARLRRQITDAEFLRLAREQAQHGG